MMMLQKKGKNRTVLLGLQGEDYVAGMFRREVIYSNPKYK
jgi:hypothetical protein